MPIAAGLIALLGQTLSPSTVGEAQLPDQTAEADRILVEGSRITTPITIIEGPSQPDIASPADSLEIIDNLPGIRAVSTGGAGGGSFVSIRGAEPNFAQVLIDGVRVTNPSSSQGGGFDFAQLDPALIQSISIVPNSRSAIYGSDALSGVVSLRLTDATSQGFFAGARTNFDSQGAYSASSRLGYGWDDGGAILAIGTADTDDLTPGSTLQRDHVFARLSHKQGNAQLSTFLLAGDTQRVGFSEASGGPELATDPALEARDTDFLIWGLSAVGADTLAIRPALRVGYYKDNVVADTPAIAPGVFDGVPALFSDTDFSRLEVSGDLRFRAHPSLDLVVGGAYQTEEADSTGTIDLGFALPTAFAIQRAQTSVFAEAEWRPVNGLRLGLAARQDWFEDQDEATLQGSAEYTLSQSGLTLFAGYGEGFRQPSLFALAFPLIANPDLLPERSKSWEAGIAGEVLGSTFKANLFANNYKDLVDFEPDLFTNVNRAQTDIKGFTLSGSGQLYSKLEWNGSITFLDLESEVPLRGRPDWSGHTRFVWRHNDQLRLGAQASFNSDLLESSIPTGTIGLDGSVAFDLFAHWQVSRQLLLSASLRNALDENWQDAVGFPAPGRTLRITADFAI